MTKPALSPLLPGFEKLPEAPKAPAGASELERLTYPPGLLGHATVTLSTAPIFPTDNLRCGEQRRGWAKSLTAS